MFALNIPFSPVYLNTLEADELLTLVESHSHPADTPEGVFLGMVSQLLRHHVTVENIDEDEIREDAYNEGHNDGRASAEGELEDAKEALEGEHKLTCVPIDVFDTMREEHRAELEVKELSLDKLREENIRLRERISELTGRVSALEDLLAPVKRKVNLRRKNGETSVSNGDREPSSGAT